MQLHVLGPIDAVDASGGRVDLGGRTQRRLAAMLVVHAGRVVSCDRLADALGLTVGGVRTAVHRLRHVVGPEVVELAPPGYRLAPAAATDLAEFVALVDEARGAGPAAAVAQLTAALGLWRGEPLAEFADEPWAQAGAAGLDELRVAAEEDRAEALLRCSQWSAAAADLLGLVERHPYRDRPRGLLMRALAAQGRQAEALRAYQAYRSVLAEEVGTEPSTELKDLERRIAAGWCERPPSARGTGRPPTGTVTCLLTRVDARALRWEEDPDDMPSPLMLHEQIVRDAVEEHGGYVVSAISDRSAAAFARAEDAVAAALQAQRALAAASWLTGATVPVGMALHTGDASERNGTYAMGALSLAVRFAGVAHGGQILVSAATADLLPPSVELIELGRHHLPGLAEAVPVAQVVVPDLPSSFPALATDRTTNLPWDPTTFVGRESDVLALRTLLARSPLVTALGAAGIGKTRLALEVARTESPADGVWFVDLGRVSAAAHVADAVATALPMESGVGGPGAAVAGWLRQRDVLLVLDNCEHVLGAVAELVEAIVSTAPDVTVLATSRAPIAAMGEQLFPVRALSLPGPDVDDADSVRLFLDRARGLEPGGVDDLVAVEEICRRLDGLPLAIELAAARTGTMSVRDIADHLDERFRLLTGGRRTAVPRHQTLHAAIEWSHRLLDERDQQLFARLSVFAGPFTLDDAVAVGGDGADEVDVLDRLASLVDRSLVVHTNDVAPYRLLDTLRAFGRLRLDAHGLAETVRAQHAAHFRDRAVELRSAVWTERGDGAYRLVVAQAADYVAALRWAYDAGDLELVGQLAVAAWDLTSDTSWSEIWTCIVPLVRACSDPPRSWSELHAFAANHVLFWEGQPAGAIALAARGLELDATEGYCHSVISFARILSGDVVAALAAAREARRLTGPEHLRSWALARVACCWYLGMLGRDAEALEMADELLERGRTTKSEKLLLWAYLAQSRGRAAGDPDAALVWLAEAEPLVVGLDDRAEWDQLYRDRASVLLDRDVPGAGRDLLGCLTTARRDNAPGMLLAALPHTVVALARLGDLGTAALLLGSPHCMAAPAPFEAARMEATEDLLRAQLGERFGQVTTQGATLGIFELVDLVVAALEAALVAVDAGPGPTEPLVP